MSIIIKRIPNKPVDSNSFVIYTQNNRNCIIIDPGSKDCNDIIKYCKKAGIKPEYIFLTHEHFDHIWGVNKLKEIYDCKIVCSTIGADMINEKRKNMSLFYDQIGFETYPADICIENIDYQLQWNGVKIEFISTQGHTDASICILIDDNLFTGDMIIRNTKTVIKLPGGSKSKLDASLSLLNNRFYNKQIMIHSGHGESFWFNEAEIQKLV